MDITILIVAVIVALIIGIALKGRAKNKRLPEDPPTGGSHETVVIKPAEQKPVTKPPLSDGSIPPARTLDEMYASANNMWVCECCETLNDNAWATCRACGARR